MKRLFLIYPVIVSAIVLLFTTACKKEEPATKPSLSTTPVTNITTVTATSGGIVANDGGASITANGVCWGTIDNPTINDSKTTDGVSSGQFVSNLAGLTAGTTYHVRSYATNSVGTSYGADMTFLTLGEAPACLTQAATNTTATGATLNGTVNANDLSTTVTFEYGVTTSYGSTATATQSPVTGNTITNVSVGVSGLLSGTTYHYRVKTLNSIGTTYSEDMTFTTLAQAPTVTTLDATSKTAISTTLNGTVNANGASTTVTFEYGTTTNYGSTATAIQSPVTGNTVANVSADITGLNPSTTYYFRLVATNSVGTTYGSQISFTTTSLSLIKSEQILSSGKADNGYGGSISISGNLAVIGAGWENTTQANKAGAVYIYEYNGNQWIEKQRITNPNGTYDNIFGHDVATNGTYIVITEPNAKSAYIYSKVGSQWVIEKKFTITNVSSEKYGISCDIYENTVVIGSGAVFATYCNAIGSAYVYEKNGTSWNNTAILIPSGGLTHDGFGVSVSIDKNTIVVGAAKADCYDGTQGYVCIYEKNGTNWLETQKLVAPDGTFADRFGERVDIENEHLIIASRGTKGIYYFQKGNSWEFKQKIISPNLSGNDNFGISISLSNHYALFGAFTDSERYTNNGAAYLFEFNGTSWNNKFKIIPTDASANGNFGYFMSLYNNSALVYGKPSDKTLSNVYAYIFE